MKTGEVRGRSYYNEKDFTGLLRGAYRPSDRRLEWKTNYTPADSENGSMTLDPTLRLAEGFLQFELPSINANFRYTNVALLRE